MSLSALLIADETEGPRLLGADLVTVQLQRALGVGANHAVILSSRGGSGLVSAMESLRALGMSVDHARTPADAADRLHPDELVLLVPEALTIAPAPLARLAGAAVPHILCVEPAAANAHFELVDAGARWTGAALIDGALVRQTAAMVGEWDFASVLLRNAVQAGARRSVLSSADQAAGLLPLTSSEAAIAAGRTLIAQTRSEPDGAGTHWLIDPVARLAARFASDSGLAPQPVMQAGLAVLALAVLAACGGWIATSLAGTLLGSMACATGSIMGRAATGLPPFRRVAGPAVSAVAMIAAAAMGITLTIRTGQWGCAVLAAVALGGVALARPYARQNAQFGQFRADGAGFLVLGLAGTAVGYPIVGLGAMALHAVISLALALRYDQREGLAGS